LIPVGGEVVEKGDRRVNMVQILNMQIDKWKNGTCCNYSRDEGRGDKEEQWRR
jgi:hypothetical protein